ncbi:HelD family protein [Thalassiella azotivora]
MPAELVTDDATLTAEQAHLERARAELARMRRQTQTLQAHGGDRVSSEYLAATLHARVRALTDDPATTLFFGRTDHDDGARWYVGRRHVADSAGDPVVVDWRADVSRAFYRAGRTDRMGVVRRRRFGVEGGRLTGYEDEHLADPDAAVEADRVSTVLTREIERPRVGPMRDIVATIQPEQDEIVRADVSTTVCVQGAPGTGKTAVGLHRAAWLLYAFGDRLARGGVLVVGPSEAFLEHVGAVLPALGEVTVRHTTVEALTSAVPVAVHDEPADVAALKGDARMAEVLRRAVWSHVDAEAVAAGEALVLPRGVRRWRVPAYEVADVVRELAGRGVRYAAARAMLAHRLAHAVLVQMERAGESPDDRVQDAVARSREVKRLVAEVWPALDVPRLLLRLLTDPDVLARAADGVLDDDEQALLLRGGPGGHGRPARGPRSVRWSEADAVLADELADLLERTPSLGHVVLDEAQDLSPMQLRAVGRRCSTGSATVLGDVAQGTTPWATPSWQEALAHLGKPDAHLEVLDRGFRVPSAVLDLASRLLPDIAPGLAPAVSVRQDPGTAELHRVDLGQVADRTLVAVREALEVPGSVGLVVADRTVPAWRGRLAREGLDAVTLGADHEDAAHRLHLVPATLAKGLEFDRVVLVEPADLVDAEPDARTGLRRLYVCLTRAVTGLAVVHGRDLPPQLDPRPASAPGRLAP